MPAGVRSSGLRVAACLDDGLTEFDCHCFSISAHRAFVGSSSIIDVVRSMRDRHNRNPQLGDRRLAIGSNGDGSGQNSFADEGGVAGLNSRDAP